MNAPRRLQYLMGTEVEIIVDAPEPTASVAVEEAFRAIERIERRFSRFDESSDIARVNRDAGSMPVKVSREVAEVVSRGLVYSRVSRDCFSIALAPLSALWRRAADESRLPGDREIAAARELADWRGVRVDRVGCSIAFARPGMALDLGGLVKGYAVDAAREALLGCGVERALVSAGESSIWAFERPSDSPWAIGVRHPGSDASLVGTLRISNQALSTSGTSARGFEIDGVRFSHLVDPRTGRPFSAEKSATAVCNSAMLAEVASKILLLEGCERGIRTCDENGWEIEGATCSCESSGPGVWTRHSHGLDLDVWRSCA